MKRKQILPALAMMALMAAPLAAHATYSDNTARFDTLAVSYPTVVAHNAQASAAINQSIAKYLDSAQRIFNAHKNVVSEGAVSYHVHYDGPQFISIEFSDYMMEKGAAHGVSQHTTVTFDKTTGQVMPLAFFLKSPSVDQLNYDIAHGYVHLLQEGGTEITDVATHLKDFSLKKVPTNYYLRGNGDVVLVAQPYEAGPYAYGAVRVVIPQPTVDFYNGKRDQDRAKHDVKDMKKVQLLGDVAQPKVSHHGHNLPVGHPVVKHHANKVTPAMEAAYHQDLANGKKATDLTNPHQEAAYHAALVTTPVAPKK